MLCFTYVFLMNIKRVYKWLFRLVCHTCHACCSFFWNFLRVSPRYFAVQILLKFLPADFKWRPQQTSAKVSVSPMLFLPYRRKWLLDLCSNEFFRGGVLPLSIRVILKVFVFKLLSREKGSVSQINGHQIIKKPSIQDFKDKSINRLERLNLLLHMLASDWTFTYIDISEV